MLIGYMMTAMYNTAIYYYIAREKKTKVDLEYCQKHEFLSKLVILR